MNRRQQIQIVPLFIFLTVISTSLVLLDENRITDPVRSFIESIMLKIRGQTVSTDNVSIDALNSKIISLESERDGLVEENRSLRKQLQSPLPPSYKFIPAIVLSKEKTVEKKELYIASGLIDGVKENMPVVSEHIIIGTIIAVTPRTSRVRLLSDPQSKITIKTSRDARGIVFGTEDENDTSSALLDRVLQSESLAVDDKVLTSGEDELPPDLLIGTLAEITTESRDPFQKGIVKLGADPLTLTRVFIISKE